MNKKIILTCALALGLIIISQGNIAAKHSHRTLKFTGYGSLRDAPSIGMSNDALRSLITSAVNSPSAMNKIIKLSKTNPRIFHVFLKKCEGDIGYREHIMTYILKTDDQEFVDLILANKDAYPKTIKMLNNFNQKALTKRS